MKKITTGLQPGETAIIDPEANDKVLEMDKWETHFHQVRYLKTMESSYSKETSGAEEKPEVEEKDEAANEQCKDSQAVGTNMNIRSAPENTNVLKLETEIHNELFPSTSSWPDLDFSSTQEQRSGCGAVISTNSRKRYQS